MSDWADPRMMDDSPFARAVREIQREENCRILLVTARCDLPAARPPVVSPMVSLE